MATILVVEDLAAPAVIGRGGQAMLVMQFLAGLRRLGHRVVFLEFLDQEPTPGMVEWFERIIGEWWRLDCAALLAPPSWESHAGLSAGQVTDIAASADGVVTLAAHYRREPWPLIGGVRPRILFDQDPGYTHLWAAGSDPLDIYGEHDVYFTVGANVGTPRSRLPTLGIDWLPLWNAVVLDFWDAGPPSSGARFRTVAGWRDYGWLEFEGSLLGPKSEEFRRFRCLPRATQETVELVTDLVEGDPDREELEASGWTVLSPEETGTPGRYRQFILGSAGEFSCAKGGYVGTRSGWFSDRSACYLAAGRPVVAQATGFEDLLPTGEGLFAVRTLEDAAGAVRAIRHDYARHSRAARAIAEEHFDSDKVLTRMLTEAGLA